MTSVLDAIGVLGLALGGAAPANINVDAVIHRVQANGDVSIAISVDKKHAIDTTGAVTLKLDGDTLVVSAAAEAEGERPTVRIVVDALNGVTAKGMAHVDVDALTSKSLALDASGSSTIALKNGKGVGALSVDASGSSHVDADQVSASSVDAKLADAARVEVWALDRVQCALKKASRLTVKGHPKDVKKDVEGVARYVNAP